ncbi:MAG: orotidine-5'-phosphate decarboxylase [Aureliella sp.]
MSDHPFAERLADACIKKSSAVCVGLDPRWGSLPDVIRSEIDSSDLQAVAGATQCYCQEVIDAVADSAPIVKPQAAFFEELGPHGLAALAGVIEHARKAGLLVLLDAKRGDIGSTAEGYARAYLGSSSPWKADALTVNPYLGDDTLQPFMSRAEQVNAGIFVLVKTSNPGSGFLQDLAVEDSTIAERVAKCVEQTSAANPTVSGFGHVGAVVGATYPEELAKMRELMPHAWILIPGFGAQGGTAEDVAHGFTKDAGGKPSGAIVNSSRGIIFAYNRPEYEGLKWQEAVAAASSDMRAQLNAAL